MIDIEFMWEVVEIRPYSCSNCDSGHNVRITHYQTLTETKAHHAYGNQSRPGLQLLRHHFKKDRYGIASIDDTLVIKEIPLMFQRA